MLSVAEQEVQSIRKLLTAPTPENCELVNNKLEYLISFLNSLTQSSGDTARDSRLREFLERLPAEMSRIRILMQAPSQFFHALESLRTVSCGYERSGILQALPSPSRTVVHM